MFRLFFFFLPAAESEVNPDTSQDQTAYQANRRRMAMRRVPSFAVNFQHVGLKTAARDGGVRGGGGSDEFHGWVGRGGGRRGSSEMR